MSMLSNVGNLFWKNFACLCSPMWLIKNRGVAVDNPLGTSTSLGDILVISEKGSHLRKVPNNPGQKYLLYFLSNSHSPCIESGVGGFVSTKHGPFSGPMTEAPQLPQPSQQLFPCDFQRRNGNPSPLSL